MGHFVAYGSLVSSVHLLQVHLLEFAISVSMKHPFQSTSLLRFAVNRKDTLYDLGICISYDNLFQLTSDASNRICERFSMDEIVSPPKMLSVIFATVPVDVIEYNPSSATAMDSFPDTEISLMIAVFW